MIRKTWVRAHKRKKPSGGRTSVRGHYRGKGESREYAPESWEETEQISEYDEILEDELLGIKTALENGNANSAYERVEHTLTMGFSDDDVIEDDLLGIKTSLEMGKENDAYERIETALTRFR